MTTMMAAALDLAAAGWAVLPCRESGPCAKAPYLPHGHLEASREPEIIRAWWSRWPNAMIGAPVPEPLLVLDIDPRNGGTLRALEELAGPLPETLTVWSGRGDGGRHLYFQRPAGALTSTKLPTGIDLKVRGYCITPPSIHPASGQPYWWEQRPVSAMPHRLRELLRPARPVVPRPRGRQGDASALVRWVAGLTENTRNSGLYWAACRAAETGRLEDVADDLVSAAVSVGLPEVEARRTVASAARKIGANA